jgi:hypothetical protein
VRPGKTKAKAIAEIKGEQKRRKKREKGKIGLFEGESTRSPALK